MSPEAKEWVDREFWMLRQRVADLERVVTQIVEADVSGIDSATARRIEQVRDRMRATDVVNGAGRERVAAVVREIAARYGVPEKALYGKQHKTAPRELLRARNMALWTVYRRYGYTFSMLARLFGLGQHTTVARAIESAGGRSNAHSGRGGVGGVSRHQRGGVAGRRMAGAVRRRG